MCLDIVLIKFVAKEDIVVYKRVICEGDKERSRFARTNLSKRGIMIAKPLKQGGKNCRRLKHAEGYKAYFHCWNHPPKETSCKSLHVKAFIIPKGTRIIVGKDIEKRVVYVARRLINPRMN